VALVEQRREFKRSHRLVGLAVVREQDCVHARDVVERAEGVHVDDAKQLVARAKGGDRVEDGAVR